MTKLEYYIGTTLLMSAIGAIYLSRFLLRKHPKMTSKDLKALDSGLENIHKTYLTFQIVVFLVSMFLMALIFKLDEAFWAKRILILFFLVGISFVLYDGVFALCTKVFPTTNKTIWDSYFYDADEEFQWVAYWQIGLAIALIIANFMYFVYML